MRWASSRGELRPSVVPRALHRLTFAVLLARPCSWHSSGLGRVTSTYA